MSVTRRASCLAAVTGALLVVVAFSVAAQSTDTGRTAGPERLNVRIGQQVSPLLAMTVAELGASEMVDLPQGAKISDEIQRRCGSLDPTVGRLLLERNEQRGLKGLSLTAAQKAPLTVEFPACARSPGPKRVVVQDRDTLEKLFVMVGEATAVAAPPPVNRTTPTTPNTQNDAGYEKLIRDNLKFGTETDAWRNMVSQYYSNLNFDQVFALNSNLTDINRLAANQELTIPGKEPFWSEIRLKVGVTSADATAKVQAAQMRDEATLLSKPVNRAVSNVPNNVEQGEAALLVTSSTIDTSAPACGKASELRADWPFSAIDLIAQIGRNRVLNPNRQPGDAVTRGRIMVLDTGLDIAENHVQIFPKEYFARIRALPNMRTNAPPKVQIVDGLNLATSVNTATTPAILGARPDRWHGLAVASAALGSRVMDDLRHVVPLPVSIIPVSLVSKEIGDPLTLSAPQLPGAVQVAAEGEKFPIINISFATPMRAKYFSDALTHAKNHSILLVVAAGNDGGDDSTGQWPSMLGGDPARADGAIVVTVGAHDADGQIAKFSRRGWRAVDLLAPGCDIPVHTMKMPDTGDRLSLTPANLSGTSFAAPLVSFVSALLYSESLLPKDIKARLISSSDPSHGLRSLTYSGGRLNAMKALSVWEDVVEIAVDANAAPGDRAAKGKPSATVVLRGEVADTQVPVKFCGKERLLDHFEKLSIVKDEKTGQRFWQFWTRSARSEDPHLMNREDLCPVDPDDKVEFSLRQRDSAVAVTVTPANLIDFVPKRR